MEEREGHGEMTCCHVETPRGKGTYTVRGRRTEPSSEPISRAPSPHGQRAAVACALGLSAGAVKDGVAAPSRVWRGALGETDAPRDEGIVCRVVSASRTLHTLATL